MLATITVLVFPPRESCMQAAVVTCTCLENDGDWSEEGMGEGSWGEVLGSALRSRGLEEGF